MSETSLNGENKNKIHAQEQKHSFSLSGKRALITGSGRGIGLAISEAFSAAGAEVFLCARTEVEVDLEAERLRSQGAKAKGFVLDVTDRIAFEQLINTLPSLDIFVNNAGTNRPMKLADVTDADYHAIMDLNVKAAIFCTRAVTNKMLKDQKAGSIINISSQMGHVGAKNRTLYCASKWAIEGFTKALAIELGENNIRVNTICPTFVETPLTQPFFKDKEFYQEVISKIKLGRLGKVEEVADAAVFLASDAAAMMTGSALMLDGGWTAE